MSKGLCSCSFLFQQIKPFIQRHIDTTQQKQLQNIALQNQLALYFGSLTSILQLSYLLPTCILCYFYCVLYILNVRDFYFIFGGVSLIYTQLLSRCYLAPGIGEGELHPLICRQLSFPTPCRSATFTLSPIYLALTRIGSCIVYINF